MNTIIYMIRHAKSPFIFGEERTRGLSKEGEIDSKKITDLMSKVKIDVIASSSYRRAIQTIEGIAEQKNIEIYPIEELRERQLKGAYKLPDDEIQNAIKKSYEDLDYFLSGGESIREVQKRSIPVIKSLLNQYKGKTIVIGTHGNIMTIIMNYFNSKYEYDFWKNTTKPDIYKLVFADTRLQDVQRIWK
ncbi:histidine phosphatase family protein [Jeotgalibacillus proteolyticus]|uniref:Histidine phosphatase family protein n=1 Tax=Jeotgalibacillus proteolyticus TaxID=2082395 RepID=A0A2S5G9F2_9BACL|nr:histidine phosphatase family protein [Jeotgalibacillus proteolyticus]PPA69554.1 histidine phosphatase family protein [Jeotgalibacillus proteolyticus]